MNCSKHIIPLLEIKKPSLHEFTVYNKNNIPSPPPSPKQICSYNKKPIIYTYSNLHDDLPNLYDDEDT